MNINFQKRNNIMSLLELKGPQVRTKHHKNNSINFRYETEAYQSPLESKSYVLIFRNNRQI